MLKECMCKHGLINAKATEIDLVNNLTLKPHNSSRPINGASIAPYKKSMI